MRFSASFLPAAFAAAAAVQAVPQQYDVLAESGAAGPISQWISSTLSGWMPTDVSDVYEQAGSVMPTMARFARDDEYAALDKPDYSDYTIWQVIQENKYLSDLKRVLKYSGPGARELLDDKSKKLTFLAPVNWRHRKHENGEGGSEDTMMPRWSSIEHEINMLEDDEQASAISYFKDDEDKERKRKMLAYLIDATLKYHVIAGDKPLNAWQVAQNSSAATALSIGHGKARKVLGNLLHGQPFRLRIGKSLLPKPSAYFNFYSRLVYPDVNVGGSIVHAVSFPLLIPPSSLQTLFFAQPYYGAFTTALQKLHVEKYLAYPINTTAAHEENYMSFMHDASRDALPMSLGGDIEAAHHGGNDSEHHHHHSYVNRKGLTGVTLFAPANLAWARLPPALRLYLFSPFGKSLLFKILALHSLPYTIFYADFVHEHKPDWAKDAVVEERVNVDTHALVRAGEWPFKVSDGEAMPMDKGNVTKYTFMTGCPKLRHHDKKSQDLDDAEHKYKFETVDVEVYRYYILPGGRGPLQTRVVVQGVPVLVQDIPTGNGAIHQIERFIKPKGHPHKGSVWHEAAEQASLYGFGDVDVAALDF